jgi:hypothetical protein
VKKIVQEEEDEDEPMANQDEESEFDQSVPQRRLI